MNPKPEPCYRCGLPESAARHHGEATAVADHEYKPMTVKQRQKLLANQRK
jgi:hypothetical protein